MNRLKKVICIIRNNKSGLITTFKSSKELYRDLLNRDLNNDYVSGQFEGFFTDEFTADITSDKNKNFMYLIPEECPASACNADKINKVFEAIGDINGVEAREDFKHYGAFEIDLKTKIIKVYEYDCKKWQQSSQ